MPRWYSKKEWCAWAVPKKSGEMSATCFVVKVEQHDNIVEIQARKAISSDKGAINKLRRRTHRSFVRLLSLSKAANKFTLSATYTLYKVEKNSFSV